MQYHKQDLVQPTSKMPQKIAINCVLISRGAPSRRTARQTRRWAEYYLAERNDADSQKRYGEIADYLRARPPHSATAG
jgi:hypothetical protein